jgi:hypothetical protein
VGTCVDRTGVAVCSLGLVESSTVGGKVLTKVRCKLVGLISWDVCEGCGTVVGEGILAALEIQAVKERSRSRIRTMYLQNFFCTKGSRVCLCPMEPGPFSVPIPSGNRHNWQN